MKNKQIISPEWSVRIDYNLRHCGGWGSVTTHFLTGTREEAISQAQQASRWVMGTA